MKHLIIPDTQVKPGVDLNYLAWVGKYIVEKKPDVVVQIGDFADMPSLSSYDTGKKSFEGRRYKDDIELTEQQKTILNSTALLVLMISDTQKLVGRCLISLILLLLTVWYILIT